MLAALGGFLLIFMLRIIDVSMGTLRMLFTVRGRKWLAGGIGAVEVAIFLTAISKVVGSGAAMEWSKFIGYCLGFGTGTILGISIEEWLAPGFTHVTIISAEWFREIAQRLRDVGYGVTESWGRGKDGMVNVLLVVARRKDFPFLMQVIKEVDSAAFVTTNEAHYVYRGYWHKIKRK